MEWFFVRSDTLFEIVIKKEDYMSIEVIRLGSTRLYIQKDISKIKRQILFLTF